MLSTPWKNHRTNRFARAATVAVLAAGLGISLVSCQSALRPSDTSFNPDSYFESLIARETSAPSGNNFAAPVAYSAAGAPPLARVDDPGPATTTAISATQPSIAKASLIGLPSANLKLDEPVVGLSLQDAIARAVKHSLAIKLESYNPAIKESQLIQAEAAFDATFFGSSQWTSNDDPLATTVLTNGQTWQNQIGVKQNLPSGAQVQANTSLTYHDIDSRGLTPLTPAGPNTYTAAIGIQVTQPLLKGFGSAVNEAPIYIAQRDQRISLSAFKQQVIKTVSDVEDAYLNLILARTTVEVRERLVVSSEQTYNLIVQRSDLDATKASINQALSALESRRADLHDSQRDLRDASDKLKQLMNDPALDINGNALINPTDKPIQEPFTYNVPDCIRTALLQRPEMQQARLQIEQADIRLTVAKNDLLPQLDLSLSAQANGLDNNFDRAFTSTVDPMNSIDFAAGIKFSIPIGNRAAEGENVQRQLERKQLIEALMNDSTQVVLDVKQELRAVFSSYDEIAIRDRVRVAAAKYFEGIIEIEDIRPRTPEFLQLKLDSQQQLAQAEEALIQSIINYNLAIMGLERAKGTLLEFDQISLERPPTSRADENLDYIRFMGKTKPTK